MAMTKQRKVLAGVMAVGLGALVLDRVLLAPPEQARASQPIAPAGTPVGPDPAPADAGPNAAEAVDTGPPSLEGLTQRLALAASTVPDDAQAGDPFALPDGWRAPAAAAPANGPAERSAFADKLRTNYRLSGIAMSGDEHLAVINGLPIRVGQVVKIEIGAESATFVLTQIHNELRQAIWHARGSGERVVMQVPGILD